MSYTIPSYKYAFAMQLPKLLECSHSDTRGRFLDAMRCRRWKSLIMDENERHKEKSHPLETSLIVAFSASHMLPKDLMRDLASYITIPINDFTIIKISDIVHAYHKMELLIHGRGGEGLSWRKKRSPYPRRLFAQPEFRNKIRQHAHISLFRRLALQGNAEQQMTDFVDHLFHS